MIIKERVKDADGRLLGYVVSDKGKDVFLDKKVVISLFADITNAVLCKNGEFRAKAGCHIDTAVRCSDRSSVRGSLSPDYYGQDYISICRLIRQCALDNKFTIDMREHKLVDLIEACNISVRAFVRGVSM